MTRRALIGILIIVGMSSIPTISAPRVRVALPLETGSARFAVIGDAGTGSRDQIEVGAQLADYRDAVGFNFVLMLGDNIYGEDDPAGVWAKFERPYLSLLRAGVCFYAALGNHDRAELDLTYARFHMRGRRYYAFDRGPVRFVVLDSNNLDPTQERWLQRRLAATPAHTWKIVCFHHPLYTSGRDHGPDVRLRSRLHPIFRQYGVDVVFSGHEHIYERLNLIDGIQYFVSGAAGALSQRGRPSAITAAWFNASQHFILVEVARDRLSFQTVAKDGHTVDVGAIAGPRS